MLGAGQGLQMPQLNLGRPPVIGFGGGFGSSVSSTNPGGQGSATQQAQASTPGVPAAVGAQAAPLAFYSENTGAASGLFPLKLPDNLFQLPPGGAAASPVPVASAEKQSPPAATSVPFVPSVPFSMPAFDFTFPAPSSSVPPEPVPARPPPPPQSGGSFLAEEQPALATHFWDVQSQHRDLFFAGETVTTPEEEQDATSGLALSQADLDPNRVPTFVKVRGLPEQQDPRVQKRKKPKRKSPFAACLSSWSAAGAR